MHEYFISMHDYIVIHGWLLTIYEVYISWKVFVEEGIDKSILPTGYEVSRIKWLANDPKS